MNTYFKRYAYPGKLFNTAPATNLGLSVVIPCYNEPNILSTLNSLAACQPVAAGVEVIVIVNEPQNCQPAIHRQNTTTLQQIATWQQGRQLPFNLLTYHLQAPDKIAGVGHARKVGMDEAARRFEAAGNQHGVICCFDADSTCDPNYFEVIYQHFHLANPKPHAAAVYYQHPWPDDPRQKAGIIHYELHLRYYVNALRYIGYPYAHHTIGSTMVVRNDIYQKVGGMNKRQAGEDFYFLHKVMPTGNFIDITTTTIYPSPRVSDRVPFGTGKAMGEWQQNNSTTLTTYNLQSFIDLGTLFGQVAAFYRVDADSLQNLIASLPQSVKAFLQHITFASELNRLNRQSTSLATFINNWYRFFNGFMVLRYLHYARDNYHPDQPVVTAAAQLARKRWPAAVGNKVTAAELLPYYQQQDRGATGL